MEMLRLCRCRREEKRCLLLRCLGGSAKGGRRRGGGGGGGGGEAVGEGGNAAEGGKLRRQGSQLDDCLQEGMSCCASVLSLPHWGMSLKIPQRGFA